jgi:hypothetical protein
MIKSRSRIEVVELPVKLFFNYNLLRRVYKLEMVDCFLSCMSVITIGFDFPDLYLMRFEVTSSIWSRFSGYRLVLP